MLLSLVIIALISCKNSGNNNNYNDGEYNNVQQENDESTEQDEIGELSCHELLKLVKDEGYRKEYLDSSDMNSSALDFVALYEYDGVYYVIVEFTSSSQQYIYCDINKRYWDAFVENEEDSYGSGYYNYIRPNTHCGCGR